MRLIRFADLAISQIAQAMAHGRPWLPEATDYWFFKRFHGTTSFAVSVDSTLAGGIICCVEHTRPLQLYIDQVAVHAAFRGKGIVQRLFHAAEERARELGCVVAWLSTDPANPAVRVWPRLGYVNCPGDRVEGALAIHSHFKGPGKDRALFRKAIAQP
jgi:ribosomal protein S18 acetylase RimI-like enzyme